MSSDASLLINTIGALFFGVIFAAILYGVTVVQTWYYITSYWHSDRWYLRSLVLVTFITDTTHQVLITAALFDYTIFNFNNPAILDRLLPVNTVELYFVGLTALLVKLFFTFRIYTLSGRNKILTLLNIGLILAEFAVTSAFGAVALRRSHFEELAPFERLCDRGLSHLCAMEITQHVFRQHENRHKQLFFVLNTGILTFLCAMATMFAILLSKGTLIYIAIYHVLGRLYINSLLATLNVRDHIRHAGRPNVQMHGGPSTITGTLPTFCAILEQERQTPTNMEIKIDTTVDQNRDTQYDVTLRTLSSPSKMESNQNRDSEYTRGI